MKTVNQGTLWRLLQAKAVSPEYRESVLARFEKASEDERMDILREVQRETLGKKRFQTK